MLNLNASEQFEVISAFRKQRAELISELLFWLQNRGCPSFSELSTWFAEKIQKLADLEFKLLGIEYDGWLPTDEDLHDGF